MGFGGRTVLRRMGEMTESLNLSTRTCAIQMGFRGHGTMVDSLG